MRDWSDTRARLAAATDPPWRIVKGASGANWINAGQYDEVLAPGRVECMSYCYGGSSIVELSDADAELIAHAPSDIADLLAENAALREALDRVERVCNQAEIKRADSMGSLAEVLASDAPAVVTSREVRRAAAVVPPVPEQHQR